MSKSVFSRKKRLYKQFGTMAMLNTNLKKIGNRFLKVLQDVETDYIKL